MGKLPFGFGPAFGRRLALGTLLAAAGGVPVALRRVRPLAALGALGAISVALSVIAAQDGLIVAPPSAYVLYMVAATCRRRVAAIALAGTLCLVLGESFNVWTSDGGRLGSAVTLGLILIIFWASAPRSGSAGRTRTACSGRRPAGRWPRNGCGSRGNCTTSWRTV